MKHIRNGEVVGGVVNEASKVTLSGGRSVETNINSINNNLDEINTNLIYTDSTVKVGDITWTVRKYNNGIVEMWAEIILNGTWNAWGNIFYLRNYYPSYLLPIPLTKKIIDITTPLHCDSSANACWGIVYTELIGSDLSTRTTCDIARATAGTNNSNYYCEKYIKGLWK